VEKNFSRRPSVVAACDKGVDWRGRRKKNSKRAALFFVAPLISIDDLHAQGQATHGKS